MKIFLSTLFFLFLFQVIPLPLHSDDEKDGIQFFSGTWQEALQKSTLENKPIFLNLSTSWCGWCKKMKLNIYSQKKAGDYFNSRFINMELDGEHGEGLRLAKRFGTTAYPSIYLVDKNENPMLSSEGYHEADDLIKLIKGAVKD